MLIKSSNRNRDLPAGSVLSQPTAPLHVPSSSERPDCNQSWILSTDFNEVCNRNFQENPSSGSRPATDGRTDGWTDRQTDGRTDVTKISGAFREHVKAPTIDLLSKIHLWSVNWASSKQKLACFYASKDPTKNNLLFGIKTTVLVGHKAACGNWPGPLYKRKKKLYFAYFGTCSPLSSGYWDLLRLG
jgi:hypothetical protein